MKRILLLSTLLLMVGVLLHPTIVTAAGQTFTVNQTADLPDASLLDNHCDTSLNITGDQCSVRAAIQQANFLRGTDTIKFVSTAANVLTRSGQDDTAALGDLDITDDVMIEGRAPATTIDGNGVDRVFDVKASASFRNLIIRGGRVTAGTAAGAVSAGVQGKTGDLSFVNVTLTDNSIVQPNVDVGCCAGVSDISCNCDVTVSESALTSGTDKGIVAKSVQITDSSILHHSNVAITINGGSSSITRTMINLVEGGVFNLGGTLEIRDSEITGGFQGINANPPLLSANGVRNEGASAVTNIVNSTISGNLAVRGGGGVANIGGTVRLFNVTIANNSTSTDCTLPPGQICFASDGGGIFNSGGTLELTNTIVANNQDVSTTGAIDPDCAGTIVSHGFNAIENGTGCTITGTTTGNRNGSDPNLGPLQNNGGPSQTIALPAGSLAIDAGNPSGCTDASGALLTTDQRGFTRPVAVLGLPATCDIGAFEATPVGIGALSPDHGKSKPGEPEMFQLAWDSPTRWRDLNTVDLRFKRGKEILLWLRFTEGLPTSTFSLLDKDGNVLDSGNVGEVKTLENKFGRLDLAQSGFTASGPNDPHVVLHFAVTFKKPAEGELKTQMLATDDFSHAQGPQPAGTWKVKK